MVKNARWEKVERKKRRAYRGLMKRVEEKERKERWKSFWQLTKESLSVAKIRRRQKDNKGNEANLLCLLVALCSSVLLVCSSLPCSSLRLPQVPPFWTFTEILYPATPPTSALRLISVRLSGATCGFRSQRLSNFPVLFFNERAIISPLCLHPTWQYPAYRESIVNRNPLLMPCGFGGLPLRFKDPEPIRKVILVKKKKKKSSKRKFMAIRCSDVDGEQVSEARRF